MKKDTGSGGTGTGLEQCQQRLRFAFEAATEGLWEWSPATRQVFFSPRWYTMLDYEPYEPPPSYELWESLLHPDDRDGVIGTAGELIEGTLDAAQAIYRMQTKTGQWRWMLCRSRVVERDVDGQATRIVGSQVDITEQKEAENALRQSEERYRTLIESQGEGIGIVDELECFTFANPAAEEIFGLPPGGMIGRSLRDLVDPEAFDSVLEQTGRRREGEQTTYELEIVRPDGTRRIILITATPRFDEQRRYRGAFGIFRDITHRKQIEDALREGEERYRLLIESLPHGVVVLQQGRIVFANQTASRILGPARLGELLDLKMLMPAVESERQHMSSPLTDPGSGRSLFPAHYFTRVRRTDGHEIPVELFVTQITHRGQPAVQIFMMDITDRLKSEEQRDRLEEQLRQAHKLESIGRLAGGIAHDFNNLLSPIILYTDMALMEMSSDDERRSDVDTLREAAIRAKNLTQQLLAFGRRQLLRVQVLDLNRIVSESCEMLRRLIREDIVISLDLDPELCQVKADPSQLQQILMNLALNARDSMSDGGTLTIETGNVVLDAVYAAAHPELRAGLYVMLEVKDTGRGMEAETLQHIFEPFFSTKDMGQGTGLGLATVHGIVKQHDGHILVDSQPGKGTIFTIYLPAVEGGEAFDEGSTPVTDLSDMRNDETILVAEDDPVVRRQVCKILAQQGFKVIEAGDGFEALELARGHDGPIHLLLTDVIMPRMNGRELYERLAVLRPKTRVVYMSGYTDDVIAEHGVLDRGIHFVQKPFSVRNLMLRIGNALRAAP